MKYPADSFQSIFWNQLLQLKDKQQIRLHPMVINWCLSLKLLISASYGQKYIVALPLNEHYEITLIVGYNRICLYANLGCAEPYKLWHTQQAVDTQLALGAHRHTHHQCGGTHN